MEFDLLMDQTEEGHDDWRRHCYFVLEDGQNLVNKWGKVVDNVPNHFWFEPVVVGNEVGDKLLDPVAKLFDVGLVQRD